MKQNTQKGPETPNLENISSNLTTQREREALPTLTSQFSMKTKGKQRTYTPKTFPKLTPKTSPKLAPNLGKLSENSLVSSTVLEID
jgi:hypothetical protein